MRANLLLLGFIFMTFSCERNDCCVQPEIELQGVFEHQLPNCDTSGGSTFNCGEWLKFINDTEVDIVYGGSDIIHRFTYTQETDFISLEGPLTSSFKPIFLINGPSELVRKDNGDIWKKQK